MAHFGLILAQTGSHGLLGSSGMPPRPKIDSGSMAAASFSLSTLRLSLCSPPMVISPLAVSLAMK